MLSCQARLNYSLDLRLALDWPSRSHSFLSFQQCSFCLRASWLQSTVIRTYKPAWPVGHVYFFLIETFDHAIQFVVSLHQMASVSIAEA
jgi:hypothetical protein